MPTPTKQRLETNDRVRIHPANGEAPYRATLTDLGAWGPTILVGTTLRFLPWSAVDLIERIEDTPALEVEPEWCEAIVAMSPDRDGNVVEKCDLRAGHDGLHRGTISGRPFRGGTR